MAGIYVHIPFCASFCRYCSFYSERCTDAAVLTRYVDALLQEISAANPAGVSPQLRLQVQDMDRWEQKAPEMRLQVQDMDRWAQGSTPQAQIFTPQTQGSTPQPHWTLYIGGGTPSLLPVDQLERIVAAVRQKFLPEVPVSETTFPEDGHKNPDFCSRNDLFEEFTLEANPDDVTPEKLAAWRRLGVNRLSIGVQSFDDAHLRWMRRRHTAAQAENAVRMAREAGFDNLSLDLIFGFAGLSDEQWAATIDRALALRPEHLSCYQMSVEEGSTLGDEAAAGAYAPPAQETCARQYALLQQRVAAAGYLQYEISNFALPGREARHNSAYWRREPYWGFGPGAHSYDGLRTRRWNRPDLAGYLAAPRQIFDSETLTDTDLANEQVMLSLRTAAGLDLETLAPAHLAALRPTLDAMLADGRLERVPGPAASPAPAASPTKNGLRIPADRLFVSDSIISDLFL